VVPEPELSVEEPPVRLRSLFSVAGPAIRQIVIILEGANRPAGQASKVACDVAIVVIKRLEHGLQFGDSGAAVSFAQGVARGTAARRAGTAVLQRAGNGIERGCAGDSILRQPA